MAAGRAAQPSDGGFGTPGMLSLCCCSVESAKLSKHGEFWLFNIKEKAAFPAWGGSSCWEGLRQGNNFVCPYFRII